MSPNIKNDFFHLVGILESVGKISLYTEQSTTAEDFFRLNEQLYFNASLSLMTNIGELSHRVSAELRKKYPDIEWIKVKDFRNRIVHDYAGLDFYTVFRIIKTELPVLKEKLENIIANELANATFDSHEFEAARNSSFYTHVDFDKLGNGNRD